MPVVEPQARRWTREEFYRMADLGFFHGQRAELIEGEIVVMSPQKWLHACTVDRVAEVLRPGFGSGAWVRTQLPLNLGLSSDPEPDVSVVPGERDDYTDHPTTALLVVEVSDTTLEYDRGRKASLYARAGIEDYWIVNLVDLQLEVYRQPRVDPSQDHGYGYGSVTVIGLTGTVVPLAGAHGGVPVGRLLP
jgi:Uma2 family endonuclease